MGFANERWSTILPAWKLHYIAYNQLKKQLRVYREAVRNGQTQEAAAALDAFTTALRTSARRADAFFAGELRRMNNRLDKIVRSRPPRDVFESRIRWHQCAIYRRTLLRTYLGCRALATFAETNLAGIHHLMRKRLYYSQRESERRSVWSKAGAKTHDLLDGLPMARPRVAIKPLLRQVEGAMSDTYEYKPGSLRSQLAAREFRRVKYDSFFNKLGVDVKWGSVAVAIVLSLVLMWLPLLPKNPAAHRCLSLLCCVAVLWVTEAMPFFATGMLVPILAVTMRVVLDPDTGEPLAAVDAAGVIFSHLFDQVLALVLGGFCLSIALRAGRFDEYLASKVLSRVSSRPRLFLFTVMILGMFLSMWMSNVAAPVLVISVVLPVLRQLKESDRWFVRLCLLGVAFSNNIGGMTTPIASPQNAIAIAAVEAAAGESIGFGQWVITALPLSLVFICVTWYMLLVLFHYAPPLPFRTSWICFWRRDQGRKSRSYLFAGDQLLKPQRQGANDGRFSSGESEYDRGRRASDGRHTNSGSISSGIRDPAEQRGALELPAVPQLSLDMDARNWVILIGSLFTVALLCLESAFQGFFGDMGVIALIPIVLFYATGVLRKHHLREVAWDVILLVGGGSMLGFAVQSSELVSIIATAVGNAVAHTNGFVVTCVFNGLVLIFSSFISNTVAAIMVLPLLATIGVQVHHMHLLVMSSAIMDSLGMPLPMSSFPNIATTSAEDEAGRTYLSARDYVSKGAPMSLIMYVLVSTVGYAWISFLHNTGLFE